MPAITFANNNNNGLKTLSLSLSLDARSVYSFRIFQEIDFGEGGKKLGFPLDQESG